MSIHPKIFDKDYYYNICLGSEEFKKSGGREIHPKIKKMIDHLSLTSEMDILEIGCGRGDTALYIASKVRSVTAIDYSPDAIRIAKDIRKKHTPPIQKKTKFSVMEATKLSFKNNSFDFILIIDTLDHLNRKEQEKMFKEINRIIKSDGTIFIRTCSNRILLSHTYRYYTYPLNRLLTWVDKKIKNVDYDSLPKDPRTKEQKQQHINEPDYFKLKKLFNKFSLTGEIKGEPGFLKEEISIRSNIYNFIVTLHPLSQYFPLHIFFANSFICKLKPQK
jgi:ubiquinone/menaquinone biosynthesis C-methylase UbiE